MIRDLRFSDMPRQLLPGGLINEDWAYTRAALSEARARRLSQMDLLRCTVPTSKPQRGVVCVERGRLAGVALLQARRGPRAWEIAHLFTSPDGLEHASEMLERCVNSVAQCGGDRVFLRVLYRSPMQDIARRAGFMPAFTEELFVTRRPLAPDMDAKSLPLRPVIAADAHDLFRLYNATVPATARAILGLTMDQWRDAAEEMRGRGQEYVWETEGQIKAYARLSLCRETLEVDASLHPDYGAEARPLITAVARLAGRHRAAAWTVPSYQPTLSMTLQRRGWELAQTYSVLARSAANRVREPGLMPVQA